MEGPLLQHPWLLVLLPLASRLGESKLALERDISPL